MRLPRVQLTLRRLMYEVAALAVAMAILIAEPDLALLLAVAFGAMAAILVLRWRQSPTLMADVISVVVVAVILISIIALQLAMTPRYRE